MSMSQPTTWRGRLGRTARSYWREAVVIGGLVLTLALPLAVPYTRRFVLGWLRCGRTRRLIRAGLAATKMFNTAGQLPRVWTVRSTVVGERVDLRTRAGQSAELLQLRMEELRAAVKARTVRIERDPHASNRITVEVVRRDPLAGTARVAWLDQDRPTLSLWDPIHIGTTELGEALRLPLVDRGVLAGGLMNSGKSSLLNLIVSTAAKSPAELYLIDPQGVQLGPWRRRATMYAQQDPGEALAVLEAVQAEIDRRLALMESLPGVVRKVTPAIAAEHGLHPFVLAIDELAYHTATVGSGGQRDRFASTARDVVSRGRAAGLIPVMATQRPTQDVVPRSLSDLFGIRCAFKTANASNSDVILGEGLAARGYNASEIDQDAPGVGLILGPSGKPERVKVAWISDELIADLSLTTIPLKPRRSVAAA
jgi:hypothetical protein